MEITRTEPTATESPTPRVTRPFAVCAILGLLWLAVALPVRHTTSPSTYDFAQYYMGGTIALTGEWAALYPEPIAASPYNAGYPLGSTVHPFYRERALASGLDVDTAYRFTQSPATALAFTPFALLDRHTAYLVWLGVLILAAWLTALSAAEIRRSCRRGTTRSLGDGVLLLTVCISPLAWTTVRTANVSALVAISIGIGLVHLHGARRGRARSDQWIALSWTVGTYLKYATALLTVLCVPLGRWRALVGTATLGVAVLIAGVAVSGTEPWRVFASDILPTMGKTPYERSNQSVTGVFAMFWPEGPPANVLRTQRILGLALLAGLGAWLWSRRQSLRQSFPCLCAATALLLCWWTVSGPLFWTHYYFYFVPLWGWLAHEMAVHRGRHWRRAAAATSIALTSCPWFVVLEWPFPYGVYMLASVPLVAGLAIARLREGVDGAIVQRGLGRPSIDPTDMADATEPSTQRAAVAARG